MPPVQTERDQGVARPVAHERQRVGSAHCAFSPAAGDDQHFERRRIVDTVGRNHFKPVRQRDAAGPRRDRDRLDLRRHAPRHGQHAERGEVDRLDPVVDEHSETHRPSSRPHHRKAGAS
jgi:hypothetical protein